jgi:hypothetical protein
MSISEEDKLKAKNKAKAYLEQSIYALALMLSIDPDDLPEEYENPITPSDDGINSELWHSHECLKVQISAYSKLA